MDGPEAEEFLLKVQQATAGPPWYMEMESPDKVRLSPQLPILTSEFPRLYFQ